MDLAYPLSSPIYKLEFLDLLWRRDFTVAAEAVRMWGSFLYSPHLHSQLRRGLATAAASESLKPLLVAAHHPAFLCRSWVARACFSVSV